MISATIESITPNLALKYLESNTQNYRALNKDRMIAYANEMSAGLWQINGEPIVFDENGTLKDGQTRLSAIVRSGVTIPMMVVRGVSKDVNVFDIGGGRTQAQIAKADGLALDPSLIGAVNLLVCRQKPAAAPKAIANNYARQHQELLIKAHTIARTGSNHATAKKSAIIAAIYVFLRLEMFSEQELKTFFTIFNSSNPAGCNRETSPIFVALKQILSITKNGRPQQIIQSEIIYLAMTDFSKGQQRTKAYKTDGCNFAKILNRLCDMDNIPRYEQK